MNCCNGIPQSATGTLVALNFSVIQDGTGNFSVANPEDDILGWSIQNGQFLTIDQYHTFQTAGDTDWVKFYGLPGMTYSIETTDVGGSCDVQLELYNDDGVTVIATENDGGIGADETLVWVCPSEGRYRIRVSNLNSDTGGGQRAAAHNGYRIKITKSGLPVHTISGSNSR